MAELSHKDKDLIGKCISGDKRSWDRFVERFSGLIHYYVSRTLEDAGMVPEDAKDVVHTVFLSLIDHDYRKLRQFEGTCTLASWIRLISIRTAIDYLRRYRRHRIVEENRETDRDAVYAVANDDPTPPDALEQDERRRILDDIVGNLTPREQLFVELYYRRELPARETAHLMHCTMGALYTMKNRIREKLRKLVDDFL